MTEITAPIILILTIVMPGNLPDVNKALSMPTVEECFVQAREWDVRGLTSGIAVKGAVAVRASCQITVNAFHGS
jgi:hypothetical protein